MTQRLFLPLITPEIYEELDGEQFFMTDKASKGVPNVGWSQAAVDFVCLLQRQLSSEKSVDPDAALRARCVALAAKHCISAAGCDDWSITALMAFQLACLRLERAAVEKDAALNLTPAKSDAFWCDVHGPKESPGTPCPKCSEDPFLDMPRMAPYAVKCARCGKAGDSDSFIAEEGDEWECPECWERLEAVERLRLIIKGKTFVTQSETPAPHEHEWTDHAYCLVCGVKYAALERKS